MSVYPGWAVKAAEYFSIGYDRWPKVYFIGTNLEEPIKIGKAVNVARRKNSIQTGNPKRLRVLASAPEGEIINEARLHRGFDDARLVGEWFKPVPTIVSMINKLKAGDRVSVAEWLNGESLDLDWMASLVYAAERGVPRVNEVSNWLDGLSDEEIERIVDIKKRMPL